MTLSRCCTTKWPDGTPWSDRKKLVWWDEEQREWTGLDVPDFTAAKPPHFRAARDARGDDAVHGDRPFIMHPDGVGWLWVPTGIKDGPLPTYYEPNESPVTSRLYPGHPVNPPADRKVRQDNPYAALGDPDTLVEIAEVGWRRVCPRGTSRVTLRRPNGFVAGRPTPRGAGASPVRGA